VSINQQDDDEGDLEFIDHEVDDAEAEHAAAAEHPRAFVVVNNSDNGDRVHFWIAFDVKVKRAIERAYKRLGVAREPGDRLTLRTDGSSVFPDEDLSVRKYILKHGGKAKIRWTFAGDTGGA